MAQSGSEVFREEVQERTTSQSLEMDTPSQAAEGDEHGVLFLSQPILSVKTALNTEPQDGIQLWKSGWVP